VRISHRNHIGPIGLLKLANLYTELNPPSYRVSQNYSSEVGLSQLSSSSNYGIRIYNNSGFPIFCILSYSCVTTAHSFAKTSTVARSYLNTILEFKYWKISISRDLSLKSFILKPPAFFSQIAYRKFDNHTSLLTPEFSARSACYKN